MLQVVIIQPLDTGSKSHPFPHALVAGIERYPATVTRRMSKSRQEKRSKIKPFVKTINYNHLMPTRYTLELENLKGVVTNDTFKEVSQREDAKKTVKKALEDRYTSGKNRWFFTPLSMSFQDWNINILTVPRILGCEEDDVFSDRRRIEYHLQNRFLQPMRPFHILMSILTSLFLHMKEADPTITD